MLLVGGSLFFTVKNSLFKRYSMSLVKLTKNFIPPRAAAARPAQLAPKWKIQN